MLVMGQCRRTGLRLIFAFIDAYEIRSFLLKMLGLLFHAYWSISKLIATRFHKQTPSYPVFLLSLKRCEQVFHPDTFQTLYQSFQTLFHTIKGYH